MGGEGARRCSRGASQETQVKKPTGVLLAILLGCSPGGVSDEILISAASDLALAMPELASAFETETGVRLNTNLGSSGQLAQQILHGAPVDVFLSADRAWVERLREAGRVEADGVAIYARGLLVLYGATGPSSDLRQLLDPGVRRIAIANPAHAPYGRAAQQALEHAGVWAEVQDKLVIAENVRQAAQFVDTKSVDIAIAALSLTDESRPHVRLPDTLHEPLDQTFAIIADRPNTATARRFTAFLLGPAGRDILKRYRFLLPELD
jgi:molybdate transport system substrate-binding protein